MIEELDKEREQVLNFLMGNDMETVAEYIHGLNMTNAQLAQGLMVAVLRKREAQPELVSAFFSEDQISSFTEFTSDLMAMPEMQVFSNALIPVAAALEVPDNAKQDGGFLVDHHPV